MQHVGGLHALSGQLYPDPHVCGVTPEIGGKPFYLILRPMGVEPGRELLYARKYK